MKDFIERLNMCPLNFCGDTVYYLTFKKTNLKNNRKAGQPFSEQK
jgi:hypothetical protein